MDETIRPAENTFRPADRTYKPADKTYKPADNRDATEKTLKPADNGSSPTGGDVDFLLKGRLYRNIKCLSDNS